MTSTSKKLAGPGDPTGWVFLGAVVVAVMAGLTVYAALRLAALFGAPQPPSNPFEAVMGLPLGVVSWSSAAWWALGGMGVTVVLLGAGAVALRRRAGRKRTRVDPAAKHLDSGRDIADLTRPAVVAAAKGRGTTPAFTGLPLGVALNGPEVVTGDEDCTVDIWGPRRGKTSTRCIRAVLAAPGPVLATENKRGLCDHTRDLRARVGRVWVFDPQRIVGEQPTWWWNPLSYITTDPDPEVAAQRLAKVLVNAARPPGAKLDSYFDSAGPSLIGNLCLWAALEGRPITDVYRQLTRPNDDQPAVDLYARGYDLNADAVRAIMDVQPKQRDGVYNTAAELMSFLVARSVQAWVTESGGRRPQFDPEKFADSSDTLYLLSREGVGSTGPLVTALVAAVTEAAERKAARSPGGRLAVPMTVVLDEAGNTVRWEQLPALYSHWGSRGILVMTVLQSWSQGVGVWGREGMRQMWSAATVRVYGGGVSETEFLREMSDLVGTYDLVSHTATTSRQGRTTSTSVRRERILDVSDLGKLPRRRALVFGADAAVLVRPVPWWETPDAAAIEASVRAHDPAAAQTLAERDEVLVT